MRDGLAAETTEEILGLNMTEQDTGNNKLFSRRCLFFTGVQAKMHKSHANMATSGTSVLLLLLLFYTPHRIEIQRYK